MDSIFITRTQFGEFSSFFASSFFFVAFIPIFIYQTIQRAHTDIQHTYNVYMANKYTIACTYMYVLQYITLRLHAGLLLYFNSFEISFQMRLQVVLHILQIEEEFINELVRSDFVLMLYSENT